MLLNRIGKYFVEKRVSILSYGAVAAVSTLALNELVLLNEELLLIFSFLFFFLTSFNLLSRLVRDELESRRLAIVTNLREFYFHNIVASIYLAEIYGLLTVILRRVRSIGFRVYRGIYRADVILDPLSNFRAIRGVRYSFVERQLRSLIVEELKLVGSIYDISEDELRREVDGLEFAEFDEARVVQSID